MKRHGKMLNVDTRRVLELAEKSRDRLMAARTTAV